MSMWVGSSTFTVITVPKIGVGAGYALMGLEGVRGLNEISSIGSGQNWVLEQAFGGNEEAYTTTGMLLDLLSMGYMQVGMDNIALDKDKNNSETNIKEKASWVNTEADNREIKESVSYKKNEETEISMVGEDKNDYLKENVTKDINRQENPDNPEVKKTIGLEDSLESKENGETANNSGSTEPFFLDAGKSNITGKGKQCLGYIDENGVIEFAIEAGRDSPISGSEMFKQMMEHFGDNVKAIEGNWGYGDNLAMVNKLTSSGMPIEEAILYTWTGKQAAKFGFTKGVVISAIGTEGNYTDITALFTK